MNCSTPASSVLHYLQQFAQTHAIESVMPSNHLILCHLLLLLPSIFRSIRVFSNESALCIRWSFSYSSSPSSEYSGWISFRIDWLDLLAVQGTLKSLLQHHSSKASIHRHSAFFTVQLSHPYMTTGKTITLTTQNFVGKVISLLFNMISRLVCNLLKLPLFILFTQFSSPKLPCKLLHVSTVCTLSLLSSIHDVGIPLFKHSLSEGHLGCGYSW